MGLIAMRWRSVPPEPREVEMEPQWTSSADFNYFLTASAKDQPRGSLRHWLHACAALVVPPDLTSTLALELEAVATLPDDRFPDAQAGLISEMKLELVALGDFVRTAQRETKYVFLDAEPID